MEPKKIVITGGPSTGKTSIIQKLEEKGFFCHHEIVRAMTIEKAREEGISSFTTNPLLSVADPLEFNRRILEARLAQYRAWKQGGPDLVFFDRGLPDVIAYMHYFGQEVDHTFMDTCREHSYDRVFLLPPWEEIYIRDSERFETYRESVGIHDCLEAAYKQFGHSLVHVPKSSVEDRVDFILASLNN